MSKRLDEIRGGIHKIIEEHIAEIDANNFGPIYDDMWEKEVPMEYVSTLTEQFWEAGIEPLEHMNYVPECYAAFLIEVPETMVVPGNCLKISTNAYCYCYMEEIIMEEGVDTIGELAFAHCNNLTSITIPSSIKMINPKAFQSCENLSYIKYNGTKDQFQKMKFTNGNLISDTINDITKSSYITVECNDGDIIL